MVAVATATTRQAGAGSALGMTNLLPGVLALPA